MEEIESAIYSLKEAIEQHFGTDTSQLAHIGPDNMHDTLKKMNKSLESAIDTASDLVNIMEDIKAIQERALKWQEMSQ